MKWLRSLLGAKKAPTRQVDLGKLALKEARKVAPPPPQPPAPSKKERKRAARLEKRERRG